jgi:hypothetical protein
MDDQLRRRIGKFAGLLAVEEHERLGRAGTFVSLELLTAEIGDELSRQLTRQELSRRADAISQKPTHACPDCGRGCPLEPDREPLILQGYRGEIEYQEPYCHCPRCRRAFFPSGAAAGTRPA